MENYFENTTNVRTKCANFRNDKRRKHSKLSSRNSRNAKYISSNFDFLMEHTNGDQMDDNTLYPPPQIANGWSTVFSSFLKKSFFFYNAAAHIHVDFVFCGFWSVSLSGVHKLHNFAQSSLIPLETFNCQVHVYFKVKLLKSDCTPPPQVQVRTCLIFC